MPVVTAEERQAINKARDARLALKAKMAAGEIEPEEYSAAYSKQPVQVERRAAQDARTAERQAARQAVTDQNLSNAQGAINAFLTDGGAE